MNCRYESSLLTQRRVFRTYARIAKRTHFSAGLCLFDNTVIGNRRRGNQFLPMPWRDTMLFIPTIEFLDTKSIIYIALIKDRIRGLRKGLLNLNVNGIGHSHYIFRRLSPCCLAISPDSIPQWNQAVRQTRRNGFFVI